MNAGEKCRELTGGRGNEIPGRKENRRQVPEHQHIEFREDRHMESVETNQIQENCQQEIKHPEGTQKPPISLKPQVCKTEQGQGTGQYSVGGQRYSNSHTE